MKASTSISLAIATLLAGCVDPHAYHSPPAATSHHIGYEVRSLPPGHRTVIIDGNRYYHHHGTYYRPRSGRYVVVEAPRTRYNTYGRREVVVTRLPRGYRVIDYRGVRYYRDNNTYYRPHGSGYIIVTRPY